MQLHLAPDLQAPHGALMTLVRAGFADVDDRDVEVRLQAAPTVLTCWVSRCRHAGGCGRPVNYVDHGRRGHCAPTRRKAVALAVDPTAHEPPETTRVVARYPYTGRVRDRRRHGTTSGVRFLVTLRLPADPAAAGEPYPRDSRDPRCRDAPVLRIADWTEELVRLAAHEARHVHQHRHGLPRSELDAERWAAARLDEHRQLRPAPAGRQALRWAAAVAARSGAP